MSDDHNQMRSGYREAFGYLSTGGLPEVLALADAARRGGAPKVQLDTEMALVLCRLAEEGLTRIEERNQPRTAAEYEARNHGSEAS